MLQYVFGKSHRTIYRIVVWSSLLMIAQSTCPVEAVLPSTHGPRGVCVVALWWSMYHDIKAALTQKAKRIFYLRYLCKVTNFSRASDKASTEICTKAKILKRTCK